MKFFALLFCLVASSVFAAPSSVNFLSSSEEKLEIRVENRVLAQVNGKPITVLDVMKKMDVLFFRQFPEYVASKAARHQYYQMSWKKVLNDLVEKELMMADAKEMKIEVTASEVRQELESSFGPNIIANLDKIAMTLSEAKEILLEEITIRKMQMYKVNAKAFRQVGPQQIKDRYQEWLKEHAQPEQWTYQVVTFKDSKDEHLAKETANFAQKWLDEGKVRPTLLNDELKRLGLLADSTRISVSEDLTVSKTEILEEYLGVMKDLEPGQFSKPLAHFSRRDQKNVYKVFKLIAIEEEKAPTLQEVELRIKNELLAKAAEVAGKEYIEYLKNHFSVNDIYLSKLQEEWQPFYLEELTR